MNYLSKLLTFIFPNLTHRSTLPELMDDPSTSTSKLESTLLQFKTINNLFSQSKSLIKKTILKDALQKKLTSLSLLDFGSGGCDSAIWFVTECKKLNIKPTVYCIDYDKRVVEFGKKQCQNIPEITLLYLDIFLEADQIPQADYIFSNHFLHHLSDEQIPHVLKTMEAKASKGLVCCDLERNILWFLAFSLISLILFRNSFIFLDGRLSIQKGFKITEFINFIVYLKGTTSAHVFRGSLGHIVLTTLMEKKHA